MHIDDNTETDKILYSNLQTQVTSIATDCTDFDINDDIVIPRYQIFCVWSCGSRSRAPSVLFCATHGINIALVNSMFQPLMTKIKLLKTNDTFFTLVHQLGLLSTAKSNIILCCLRVENVSFVINDSFSRICAEKGLVYQSC